MSSDHVWLLRRPLPSRRFPPIIKASPARRRPAGVDMTDSLLLDQGETGVRGSSRQEAESPAPRAAPPTPLLPVTSTSTSTLLMDRVTEGFPCKPARSCYKNPLLTFLQTDKRFSAPPPVFCLSDFLQSRNGSQHNFQSPPV